MVGIVSTVPRMMLSEVGTVMIGIVSTAAKAMMPSQSGQPAARDSVRLASEQVTQVLRPAQEVLLRQPRSQPTTQQLASPRSSPFWANLGSACMRRALPSMVSSVWLKYGL